MKTIYRYAAALLMAAVGGVVSEAQNLQTAMFDDNYLYRYMVNPAYANEGKGFVAMPGLGNLNVTTNGTIGLNHIFYNVNGQTTTLLNPGLSAAEVLDGMKDHSRLGIDLRETILAFGFKGLKGYNTITIGARSNASIGIPKEIIRLAKEGLSNDTYDLSNLGATGRAWAEIALNHSHQITKQLRIGASVKVLLGVGAFDAQVNTANLKLNPDKYIAEVDATMHGSVKGFSYKTDYNDNTRRRYVSGVDINDFSPIGGFGFAADLGAVYTLNSDWEFSLAVTDLGFISWSNDVVATTNGLQTVESDSFAFNVDNNDSWDKFRDNLTYLYQLEDKGDVGSRKTGIGTTLTAAGKYTFPLYRRLNFGLSYTQRINGDYSWTQFRLGATVEPVKFLSAGVNMGVGTFGVGFGCLLNIKVPGFNLFVASDCLPGKLAKQGVPLNSNYNVNFGLNFPF